MNAASALLGKTEKSILHLTRYHINYFGFVSSPLERLLQFGFDVEYNVPDGLGCISRETHVECFKLKSAEEGILDYGDIPIDEACNLLWDSILEGFRLLDCIKHCNKVLLNPMRDKLVNHIAIHNMMAQHFITVFEKEYDLVFPHYASSGRLADIFLLLTTKGKSVFKHLALMDDDETQARLIAILSVSDLDDEEFDNQWTRTSVYKRYNDLIANGTHDELCQVTPMNWGWLDATPRRSPDTRIIPVMTDHTQFVYNVTARDVVLKHLNSCYDEETESIRASYKSSNFIRPTSIDDILTLLYLTELSIGGVIYRLYYSPMTFTEWQVDSKELHHGIIIDFIKHAKEGINDSLKKNTFADRSDAYFEMWSKINTMTEDISYSLRGELMPDYAIDVNKALGYHLLLVDALQDLFDISYVNVLKEIERVCKN